MRYDVFIERAQSGMRLEDVARRIAGDYGLPASALAQRLSSGRFRVKAGIELSVAEGLVRHLESLGAMCSVDEAADGATVSAGAHERAASAARPGIAGDFPVGLAAATSNATDTDLGALATLDGLLSLADVDGSDNRRVSGASKSTGGDGAPASADAFAPPGRSAPPPIIDPSLSSGSSEPHASVPTAHAFSPPGEDDEALELLEEAPWQAAAAAPFAPSAEISASHGPAPIASPAPAAVRVDGGPASPMARARNQLAADSRLRVLVGVMLALLIGFVAAHLAASVQERGYAALDARLVAQRAEAGETLVAWQAFAERRQEHLARKQAMQTRIAITGLLVWGLAAAGVGYLWFRRIPWQPAVRA